MKNALFGAISKIFFKSKDEWEHYRHTALGSSDTIDLDKVYRNNSASAIKIKEAIAKKSDIKKTQAALASYCFSLISIAWPDHPILKDNTKVDVSALDDIDSLWYSLNESVDSSTSGSDKSDSFGSSAYTNADDNSLFITGQNPNIQVTIKKEPQDDEYVFTPRIKRNNHSTSTPENTRITRSLSRAPYDEIKSSEL